jgi:hypothetical protein
MNPVLVAWDNVYQVGKQELRWEIGTAEYIAAVAARVEACGRLAREIHAAGGPKELVAFVMTPPQSQTGTASATIVDSVTGTNRKAIKKAALENCVVRYIELIKAHPDGAPEPREVLARKMMNEFRVTWHEAPDCRRQAIKRTGNLKWLRHGRPSRG